MCNMREVVKSDRRKLCQMGLCEGNCSSTILYVYSHTVAYTPAVCIKSRSVLITLMIQLLQRKTDSPASARRVSFKQL